MSDDEEIRRAAADHVQARGSGALDWLQEQAEITDAIQDYEAADTWREIAAAARVIPAIGDPMSGGVRLFTAFAAAAARGGGFQ